MATPLAGIGTLGFDAEPPRGAFAPRASEALSKAHVKQVGKAGFVVRKLTEKLRCRQGFLCRALSCVHKGYVCKGDCRPFLGESEPPFLGIAVLVFDDEEAFWDAIKTPEFAAAVQDVANFADPSLVPTFLLHEVTTS